MLSNRYAYPILRWQSIGALRQLGFTLIELIMVVIMMGILAVFITPRLLNSDGFNARGFHDETLAFVRYAQKTAIAQRRTVCISFIGDSATLRMASLAANTACDSALQGPKGDRPGTITARPGTSYRVTPTDFNFDGLGQPVNAAGALLGRQAIQVRNAENGITVEAVTGYTHE